jgi:hypothetical protein
MKYITELKPRAVKDLKELREAKAVESEIPTVSWSDIKSELLSE